MDSNGFGRRREPLPTSLQGAEQSASRSCMDGRGSCRLQRWPALVRQIEYRQGYTDLNFVIPELVQQIEYRKGTYYADVGDFSGTAAVCEPSVLIATRERK